MRKYIILRRNDMILRRNDNIGTTISERSSYKSATRVCRMWHTICVGELRWMVAKYSNHLWTLMDKYPDEPWCWRGISENPNTTWEMIEMSFRVDPEQKWSRLNGSYNPNITWEIIESHPEKTWHWCHLSQNPNITWEIIEGHPEKSWDWNRISQNPNI